MKFIFSLLAFIVSIQYTGYAQESYFAIRGGYISSTLNSSNSSSLSIEPRDAFSIGLVYCDEPNSNMGTIGYSFELGYTRKGTKIDHDTLDYKFHYFTAPLLLDFYPIRQIKLSAGPEFGFMTGAKNHSSDSTSTSILNTYDNRLEVAGVVGASASLTFFMDLGVRYSYSFTKVSKYDAILDRQDLYNSYLQIYLLLKIAN